MIANKVFSMTAKPGFKVHLGVLDASTIDLDRHGLVASAENQNGLRRMVALLRRHANANHQAVLTGHLPPLFVVHRDGRYELWADNRQGWGVGYNLYLMGVLSGILHAKAGRKKRAAH